MQREALCRNRTSTNFAENQEYQFAVFDYGAFRGAAGGMFELRECASHAVANLAADVARCEVQIFWTKPAVQVAVVGRIDVDTWAMPAGINTVGLQGRAPQQG
ncbi:hypothetical protein [Cupriavidus basilensis]|uniref:hypothetical protein n=1 Tax=Cupriavidus basilensis TaxID=68895 RepID=UPI0020A68636|nr:hypothetical protein [Cupriavidus basilensis]